MAKCDIAISINTKIVQVVYIVCTSFYWWITASVTDFNKPGTAYRHCPDIRLTETFVVIIIKNIPSE